MRARPMNKKQNSGGGSGTGSVSHVRSHQKQRSNFLLAYSPTSLSQALRVILLILIGLGFTRITHVAQASPGALAGGTVSHGIMGDLRNRR